MAMFTSPNLNHVRVCRISINFFVDLLPRVFQATLDTHAIGKRLSITEPTQSVFLFLIVFYANTPAALALVIARHFGLCKHAWKHSVSGGKKSSSNKVLSLRHHMRFGKSLNRNATRDWQKLLRIYRFADNKLIKRSLSIFRFWACACTKSCSMIRRFRLTPRSGLAPS